MVIVVVEMRTLRGNLHTTRIEATLDRPGTSVLAVNISLVIGTHRPWSTLHPSATVAIPSHAHTVVIIMRRVKIFSGSSHPLLVDSICERLSTSPADCELKSFSNGETSVNVSTSVRDQDVFIVQSGSSKINDSVMELLVMISACKGGSAKSITGSSEWQGSMGKSLTDCGSCDAVSFKPALEPTALLMIVQILPVLSAVKEETPPWRHHCQTTGEPALCCWHPSCHHCRPSRMSMSCRFNGEKERLKKEQAPPTQGFFGKPVDNLRAEPLIARWIRINVHEWRDAVVVSKNAGGTKRVTSLADVLKLNFALVTTQPRRPHTVSNSLNGSMVFDSYGDVNGASSFDAPADSAERHPKISPRSTLQMNGTPPTSHPRSINIPQNSSPLTQSTRIDSASPPSARTPVPREQPMFTNLRTEEPENEEEGGEDYVDERAREVVTGRLIQGHIVDDDAPSPSLSAMSGSNVGGFPSPRDVLPSPTLEDSDPMTTSFISSISRRTTDHADPGEASDEEEGFKDPELEHTVTLVGNVQDRVVLIVDDMIDQCGSWIAAAETVAKRGEAKEVYCIATHGLFGDDSIERMEACECIDHIVVTNTYPIAPERVRRCRKLVILDISHLLAEAIRRNHYGESISALFQHFPD